MGLDHNIRKYWSGKLAYEWSAEITRNMLKASLLLVLLCHGMQFVLYGRAIAAYVQIAAARSNTSIPIPFRVAVVSVKLRDIFEFFSVDVGMKKARLC